jgi:hypothetical protein
MPDGFFGSLAKPTTLNSPAPFTKVSSPAPSPAVSLSAASPVQASSAPVTPAQPASAAVTTSVARDLEKINSVLALLAEVGYTGLNAEDLGKLNPPDEYETELHVMAEVRGYFQVSYKVRTSVHTQAIYKLRLTPICYAEGY